MTVRNLSNGGKQRDAYKCTVGELSKIKNGDFADAEAPTTIADWTYTGGNTVQVVDSGTQGGMTLPAMSLDTVNPAPGSNQIAEAHPPEPIGIYYGADYSITIGFQYRQRDSYAKTYFQAQLWAGATFATATLVGWDIYLESNNATEINRTVTLTTNGNGVSGDNLYLSFYNDNKTAPLDGSTPNTTENGRAVLIDNVSVGPLIDLKSTKGIYIYDAEKKHYVSQKTGLIYSVAELADATVCDMTELLDYAPFVISLGDAFPSGAVAGQTLLVQHNDVVKETYEWDGLVWQLKSVNYDPYMCLVGTVPTIPNVDFSDGTGSVHSSSGGTIFQVFPETSLGLNPPTFLGNVAQLDCSSDVNGFYQIEIGTFTEGATVIVGWESARRAGFTIGKYKVQLLSNTTVVAESLPFDNNEDSTIALQEVETFTMSGGVDGEQLFVRFIGDVAGLYLFDNISFGSIVTPTDETTFYKYDSSQNTYLEQETLNPTAYLTLYNNNATVCDMGAGGADVEHSTGVWDGGVLSTGGTSTTFSISDGFGHIVDAYTDPNNPTSTKVEWTGLTDIEVTNIATQLITFVSIDSGGNVIQRATRWTDSEHRDELVIGVVVHVDNVSVDAVNNEQQLGIDPISQIHDVMEGLGFVNVDGNVFSANGANLNIDKSAGIMMGGGINYANDPKNPHKLTLPQLTIAQFQYRLQDGTNVTGLTNTLVDPENYDDAGVLTTVPQNDWTVQRIYSFTSNNVKIQYGQETYPTKEDAINAVGNQGFVTEPSIKSNGMLRGFLVVKEGITDLSSTDNAVFISANKIGEGSGGGAGVNFTPIPLAAGDPLPTVDEAGKLLYTTVTGVEGETTEQVYVSTGTIWQLLVTSGSSGNWIDAGELTITAVTTNPTKATVREDDKMLYRLLPDNWIEVEMIYTAVSSAGAAQGSGDYIFALPAGYLIDETYPKQDVINTAIASPWTASGTTLPNSALRTSEGYVKQVSAYASIKPLPYSTSSVRFITNDGTSGNNVVKPGHYQLNANGKAMYCRFKYKYVL